MQQKSVSPSHRPPSLASGQVRVTATIIRWMIAAALVVGCTSKEDRSAPEQAKTAEDSFERVRTETREATHAMKDYTYAQKDEFVQTMKQDLAAIEEELDQLSARAERANEAAKADAKMRLKDVREKWAQTKGQIDRAEAATESSWDTVKSNTRQAYGELKESLEDSRQWLSDKIAP